jgi:hypothetical protein
MRNGFEVLSYVPGGTQIKLNGTSMSSPQVSESSSGKLLDDKASTDSVQQLRDADHQRRRRPQMAGDRDSQANEPEEVVGAAREDVTSARLIAGD